MIGSTQKVLIKLMLVFDCSAIVEKLSRVFFCFLFSLYIQFNFFELNFSFLRLFCSVDIECLIVMWYVVFLLHHFDFASMLSGYLSVAAIFGVSQIYSRATAGLSLAYFN